MTADASSTDAHTFRKRCYDCFRPQQYCFCDSIPRVQNRTNIVILQHVKERFHAFNTARIVSRSLDRCELVVRQTPELAQLEFPTHGRTGLLYPNHDAALLDDLPADKRPENLVVLDGTWHHAKTLMNQIPALQKLPTVRLAPERPSEYRIRREPTAQSLSTVEAVVAALRALEPQLSNLDDLLNAFRRMIDDQIQHPIREARIRKRKPGRPVSINIPSVLLGDLNRVVVVYGESLRGNCFESSTHDSIVETPAEIPPLVSVVATRLKDDQCFEQLLQLPGLPTQMIRQHLQLTEDDFDHGVSEGDFRRRWQQFIRPNDVLCAFNQSTLHRLQQMTGPIERSVTLKAVNCGVRFRTLDDLVKRLELTAPKLPIKGRAAKRLASAAAYVRYLNRRAL